MSRQPTCSINCVPTEALGVCIPCTCYSRTELNTENQVRVTGDQKRTHLALDVLCRDQSCEATSLAHINWWIIAVRARYESFLRLILHGVQQDDVLVEKEPLHELTKLSYLAGGKLSCDNVNATPTSYTGYKLIPSPLNCRCSLLISIASIMHSFALSPLDVKVFISLLAHEVIENLGAAAPAVCFLTIPTSFYQHCRQH